jgi:hypothetical protein
MNRYPTSDRIDLQEQQQIIATPLSTIRGEIKVKMRSEQSFKGEIAVVFALT